MTEIEIHCYEKIAQHIHSKGVEMLQGGNACSMPVSVLFYIEDMFRLHEVESSLITALADDLEKHNRECLDALQDMGDSDYGY